MVVDVGEGARGALGHPVAEDRYPGPGRGPDTYPSGVRQLVGRPRCLLRAGGTTVGQDGQAHQRFPARNY